VLFEEYNLLDDGSFFFLFLKSKKSIRQDPFPRATPLIWGL
jgi:hypothetical protein